MYVLHEVFLPAGYRKAIAEAGALKIQFVQDEYREVNRLSETIADLGVDILFSLYPASIVDRVYDHPRLSKLIKVKTLTGYVPKSLVGHDTPPISARHRHIGYRARELPYWLGHLGQEKRWIADGLENLAPKEGLIVDVSWREEDRMYGKKWVEFLSDSRATLITESGSSITDKDGSIQMKVEKYLELHPNASFEEVSQKILFKYEGNIVNNVMSPRIFEAAVLKTPMVAFPGEYEGVIEAGKHYITLEKDFSNFREVAELLKDDDFLQNLADRTYYDLIDSGAYCPSNLAKSVDQVIDTHANQASAARSHLIVGGVQYKLTTILLARTLPILLWRTLPILLWWYPIQEIRAMAQILRERRSLSERIEKITKKSYKVFSKIGMVSRIRVGFFFLPILIGFIVIYNVDFVTGVLIHIIYLAFTIMIGFWSSKKTAP